VPEAEVTIDESLVRRLLAEQHPDLAGEPLEVAAEGWDNVTVRCGQDLAIRLPRRQLGADCLDVELRWLPGIAPHMPVAIPAAIRTGEPSEEYPWRWGIVPWIDGVQAAELPPTSDQARRLGAILATLHTLPLPDDPPHNQYRGGPLAPRTQLTVERLARFEAMEEPSGVDFDRLRAIFLAGAAEEIDVASTWVHGDLHPRNVVVRSGRIVGIIDWGDMCAGDPCTDLSAAWLFFDPEHHNAIWDVYEPTESTMVRARGWTVAFGAMLFEAGRTGDPYLEAAGGDALRRLLS
jgi:aminoglycoside phosphotransferase (APT) family kinase protein